MPRKKKGSKVKKNVSFEAPIVENVEEIPFIRSNSSRQNKNVPPEQCPGMSDAEFEQVREEWIQNYAAYLDEVKDSDPETYKRLIKDLQASVQSRNSGENGFSPKVPGMEGKVMGKGGIVSDKEPEGIKIEPEIGFVIKTFDLKTGKKVFINVVHSHLLKKPAMKKKIGEDGKEIEGLNIPLSLGVPRLAKDKKGASCIVYDMVVNSVVIDEATSDKTGNYRHFVCNMALTYVQQKFRCEVDLKYKLPRTKYIYGESDSKLDKQEKTKPRSQYIRKDLAPKIEEVGRSENPKNNSNLSKSKVGGSPNPNPKKKTGVNVKENSGSNRVTKLSYAAYKIRCRYENDPPEGRELTDYQKVNGCGAHVRFHHEFQIVFSYEIVDIITLYNEYQKSSIPLKESQKSSKPLKESVKKSIHIEMSNNFIAVSIVGYRKQEIFLPCPVLKGNVDEIATFNGQQKTLDILLQVDPSGGSCRGPDPGSRAWLLARALEQPNSAGKPIITQDTKSFISPDNDTIAEVSDEVWAEDAFHAQDMLSQHYLSQKQENKTKRSKDKAEERRKAEDDPNLNIEYIDDVNEWAKKQNVDIKAPVGTDGSIQIKGMNVSIDAEKVTKAKLQIDRNRKLEEEIMRKKAESKLAAIPCPVPRSHDPHSKVLSATHEMMFDLLD